MSSGEDSTPPELSQSEHYHFNFLKFCSLLSFCPLKFLCFCENRRQMSSTLSTRRMKSSFQDTYSNWVHLSFDGNNFGLKLSKDDVITSVCLKSSKKLCLYYMYYTCTPLFYLTFRYNCIWEGTHCGEYKRH